MIKYLFIFFFGAMIGFFGVAISVAAGDSERCYECKNQWRSIARDLGMDIESLQKRNAYLEQEIERLKRGADDESLFQRKR